MLEGLNILVTGASGFVGGHLVRAVSRCGGVPWPMIRKTSSHKGLESFKGSLRYADLRGGEGLEQALSGADMVFHVAGLTRACSARDFEEVNGRGVARLAKACLVAAPGCKRFVLVSSLSAAGPSGRGQPTTEEQVPAPVSAYGRSKLRGEQELLRCLDGRIPWTIVRPPIVYGPAERDLFKIFRFCGKGWVPLVRGGRPRYSVVFGPDLAQALVKLSLHPQGANRTFFVAEEQDYSGKELVAHVGAAVGRLPKTPSCPLWAVRLMAAGGSLSQLVRRRATMVTLAKLPEILSLGWVCDASRARALVPDLCPTAFPEGVRETAAWYRQEGWL